eukprot:5644925-Amphidinium_carterae.1
MPRCALRNSLGCQPCPLRPAVHPRLGNPAGNPVAYCTFRSTHKGSHTQSCVRARVRVAMCKVCGA